MMDREEPLTGVLRPYDVPGSRGATNGLSVSARGAGVSARLWAIPGIRRDAGDARRAGNERRRDDGAADEGVLAEAGGGWLLRPRLAAGIRRRREVGALSARLQLRDDVPPAAGADRHAEHGGAGADARGQRGAEARVPAPHPARR